ncbi:GTP cyclohydrolase II [Planctomicrobium piriforme]|uniref:GTP cyclohydrolase-2 n=1 Tax=Planctomicrobium piriforme TaxID=1576369 RepID=A0A1I3LU57_9PLAN|nr:GTP cyclohydrolase II [Planctomicrobium piriforme]SFI88308.1 3,4-dihydroxy 2-butanone 4-phosphate synthase / GTP cyclohydrolase II [Planctomicrobium piriforme]
MPDEHGPILNTLDEALQQLKAGGMIVVLDAQDRENEGDLICAAEFMTPAHVDFMLRKGAGVLCAPLSHDTAERLHLSPIVDRELNTTLHQTPFLIPLDHRDSGTGVSAQARARTLQALADPQSQSRDFVRPGHISPLLAREGGVLRRAGHTEATVDLMKMAGLTPVGCLIEICSQRGDGMADVEELKELCAEYKLPMISIAQIIQHRRIREDLIHREVEVSIPTEEFGTPTFISYRVEHDDQEPLAIVWGDLSSVKAPLVRMHSSCFTGDVLGSLRCDCGDQLHMAMQMIVQEGCGAVVYLPQEGRGIGLAAKLKAYKLQDEGLDTVEANHRLGFKADLRDYMVGLQILKDLGLSEIRILTNNPKKTEAFEEWVDLKVVAQVPIVAPPHEHRTRYMDTKRLKMGHLLPPSGGDVKRPTT